MHHSQDRHINVPGTQVKKDRRGGTHNAPTHIHMKPTHDRRLWSIELWF